MNEFKDQLDAAEKEKVSKLVSELRELAVKGQAADASITADIIREKINETQQASLGLFQKVSLYLLPQRCRRIDGFSAQVYEKRNAENNASSESSETSEGDKDKDKKE